MKLFEKDSPSGEVLLTWWNQLQNKNGDRATLQRCNTPAETVYLPVSQILLSKIKDCEDINFKLSFDRVCALAGILSHIKENTNQSFAKQISQKKQGSEQSLISDIRFRRLLQYSNIVDDDFFFQKIIRVIHHVDRKVNIGDLFYSLYFWGDKVKKQWAYEYYGTNNKSENEIDEQSTLIAQGANNE